MQAQSYRITTLSDLENFNQLSEDDLLKIEFLFLHLPSLIHLPPQMRHLSNLHRLTLFHCEQLADLPHWIGDFSSLRGLILRDCYSLRSFPENLGNLPQLSYFSCENMLLSSLPSSIAQCPSLDDIFLKEDYLKLKQAFLDGLFPYCSSLSEIQALCIHSLPESWGDILYLRKLTLEGLLFIESFPSSFGKLFALDIELERFVGKELLSEFDPYPLYYDHDHAGGEPLLQIPAFLKSIESFESYWQENGRYTNSFAHSRSGGLTAEQILRVHAVYDYICTCQDQFVREKLNYEFKYYYPHINRILL